MNRYLSIAFTLYVASLALMAIYNAADGYAHAEAKLQRHRVNSVLCLQNPALDSGHREACEIDHAHKNMSPFVFALRSVAAEFTLCPPNGCPSLAISLSWTGALLVFAGVLAVLVVGLCGVGTFAMRRKLMLAQDVAASVESLQPLPGTNLRRRAHPQLTIINNE